jgi:hypothetical protein
MFARDQFVAEFAPKFGVEKKHLYREVDLVDDTLAGTVTAGKEFEVLDSIVLPVAVDVVDGFVGAQLASDVLGHDVTMLQGLVFFSGDERWDRNPDVAVAFFVPSEIASFKFSKCLRLLGFGLAFWATVFLFGVYSSRTRFAASMYRFAAVLAGQCVFLVGCFSAACVRAFHGTVQRVSAVFFSIRSQVRLPHDERFATLFAGKFDRSLTYGWFAVGSMIASAREATVFAAFFGFARRTLKWLPAVFALDLDRHGCAPLFGDKDERSYVARGCQVAFV